MYSKIEPGCSRVPSAIADRRISFTADLNEHNIELTNKGPSQALRRLLYGLIVSPCDSDFYFEPGCSRVPSAIAELRIRLKSDLTVSEAMRDT